MSRRRLPVGYYPDRGTSDPLVLDVEATIATGDSYLDIPMPPNCTMVVSAQDWCLTDAATPGDFVMARSMVLGTRRNGTGAPSVPTVVYALTASGVMAATPGEAIVNVGPTGAVLRLSCAFTVATLAKLRARLSVLCVPLS